MSPMLFARIFKGLGSYHVRSSTGMTASSRMDGIASAELEAFEPPNIYRCLRL